MPHPLPAVGLYPSSAHSRLEALEALPVPLAAPASRSPKEEDSWLPGGQSSPTSSACSTEAWNVSPKKTSVSDLRTSCQLLELCIGAPTLVLIYSYSFICMYIFSISDPIKCLRFNSVKKKKKKDQAVWLKSNHHNTMDHFQKTFSTFNWLTDNSPMRSKLLLLTRMCFRRLHWGR